MAAVEEAASVAEVAVTALRSATSAARLATSRVTAQRPVPRTVVTQEEADAEVEGSPRARPVIHAEASDICRATVSRARSATTALALDISAGTVLSPRSGRATTVARRGTFRATARTRPVAQRQRHPRIERTYLYSCLSVFLASRCTFV